jgi:hypothetical protein
MTIKPNFPNAIEITDKAFFLLIDNDEKSWRDYNSNEISEWTLYHREGVKLLSICNFVSGVTQYYIQDINA